MRSRLPSVACGFAVAALLAVAPAPADAGPRKAARGSPRPAKVRYAPTKEIETTLAARTGVRSAEERLAAAAAAGPRTITGTERLTGVVLASELVIADGSSVVIEGGATICVAGDLRIEGAVACELAPVNPMAREGYSSNTDDILFEVEGNVVVDAPITGQDGRDGSSHVENTSGAGQEGGRGQGFGFSVGGDLVVGADITPGRGGIGGGAFVQGLPGTSSVQAVGARGGPAGNVTIVSSHTGRIVAGGGFIRLRSGGPGGDAGCTGGDALDPEDCAVNGPAGGSAEAIGGNGGSGTILVIGPGLAVVAPDGDPLIVLTLLVNVQPGDTFQPLIDGSPLEQTMLRSVGGPAMATGGTGASPPDCTDLEETCPTRGPRPGRGGPGGAAVARGGNGGQLPIIVCPDSAFPALAVTDFRFSFFVPGGGSATARGGDGGQGADASRARRPFGGARAGDGGPALAAPGVAGTVPLVSAPRFVLRLSGRDAPAVRPSDLTPEQFARLQLALHGRASADGGTAGSGGDGGDCCDSPGGRGGAGGRAGAPGIGTLRIPRGLLDIPAGQFVARLGPGGATGAAGAACPPNDGGGGGTGTPDDPHRVPPIAGGCQDFQDSSGPIVGFDFYLEGSNEGLARPPRNTVLRLGSTLFAEGSNFVVQIDVNGLRVKDEVVAEVGRLQNLSDVFVKTPVGGDLCVEVRVNGTLIQRLRFSTS